MNKQKGFTVLETLITAAAASGFLLLVGVQSSNALDVKNEFSSKLNSANEICLQVSVEAGVVPACM